METVSERIARAINNAPLKMGDIAKKLNTTYHTIFRWRNAERKDFKEYEIDKLCEVLHLRKMWVLYGEGEVYTEPGLNLRMIKSAKDRQGSSYSGVDQILSEAKSKVSKLIRDLREIESELDSARSKLPERERF